MTTRVAVIACARELLGVRFAHQGRNAQYGLDCLGFLIVTAERLGLTFSGHPPSALDTRDYSTRPDAAALKQKLDQWLLPANEAMAGDILLLAIQGEPQHLALVSDYPVAGEIAMIHAYAPARKVVEHRYDAHWRKATRAIYRLPQVTG
jgi:hypothetical protein